MKLPSLRPYPCRRGRKNKCCYPSHQPDPLDHEGIQDEWKVLATFPLLPIWLPTSRYTLGLLSPPHTFMILDFSCLYYSTPSTLCLHSGFFKTCLPPPQEGQVMDPRWEGTWLGPESETQMWDMLRFGSWNPSSLPALSQLCGRGSGILLHGSLCSVWGSGSQCQDHSLLTG